jgi:hypothetical protein
MATKPWSQMTPLERAAYKSVAHDNIETTNESIAHCRRRLKDPNRSPEEESFIDKNLPKLVYERAKIEAKRAARTSPGVVIEPPTEDQVAEAERMSDKTDQLQNDMNGLRGGLQLAQAAGQLMSKIQTLPEIST